MSLKSVALNASLQWQLSKTNTGFGNTTEGPDSASFNLNSIAVATFNQIFTQQYTVASSGGTQTIDLSTFTNLVSEATGFLHALTILVLPTGAAIKMQAGASNPLQWFLGGTGAGAAITISKGGCFLCSEPVAGPGAVVDGTHKTLLFTNNDGANACTLTIVVLGSTT